MGIAYLKGNMDDIKLLPLSELLDLLADQTSKYFRMVHLGGYTKEEFRQCRELMTDLQLEIYDRKAKGDLSA